MRAVFGNQQISCFYLQL